jgi:hypothetical protein
MPVSYQNPVLLLIEVWIYAIKVIPH